MRASQLADYEPLVYDDRVEKTAEKLRSEFGRKVLEQTSFVTFVQPARQVTTKTREGIEVPTWIEEMAVFAAVTPNPRRPGQKILTSITASLRDWDQSERERAHFVGKPDPIHGFFRLVLREHLPTIANLRDMH